jgi:excisionase family DNA binding protein
MTNQHLLTIPQFARELGISEYIARAMVANRQIETIKIGKRCRIHSATVRAILERGLQTLNA